MAKKPPTIMTKTNIKKMPMGQALLELNDAMAAKNMEPVTLNVVGGFALMTRNLRPPETITDIDYVGDPMSEKFMTMADRIGKKYKLPHRWINNDVMLSGIDVEDFQFATGELHFDPAISLSHIQVNVLQEEDLLRMKLIALDTAALSAETGGDFTRLKDFDDVLALMARQDLTTTDLSTMFHTYIEPSTVALVKTYQEKGVDGIDDWLHETQKQYQEDLFVTRSLSSPDRPMSDFVKSMLQQAYDRAIKEDLGEPEKP